ncbi:HpcH/HpaI aldolase/citrate lyase family protein [Deinococcus sp.]|uniref:HpcH/HpaI aldolase/citrate lyase family protein n=1 Tax=Deinococcus sp. TaxID=47478 RepID=UPI0025C50B81|nr:HpcH/HpaI aldolase/citrate lyase family protein [Deinococcus sp.]
MSQLNPWQLGASLYVPAARPDLLALGQGKYPRLGSLIYCTEDAVRPEDVPLALANLRGVLPQLSAAGGPLRFIRVRNPVVLAQVLEYDLGGISGFVLPKVHGGNLGDYLRLIERQAPAHIRVMPTLETREALSEDHMNLLRDQIFHECWQERILSLRIGGNDLLNVLGVRRARGRTLYEGPLERVISMLVGVFKPYGLNLSSPVYEVFSDSETLERELRQDLDYGLCGKTIVHPAQIDTVINGYRVAETDVAEAQAILAPDAPAVFSLHGRMCEPATHSRWAQEVLTRAELYGVSRV